LSFRLDPGEAIATEFQRSARLFAERPGALARRFAADWQTSQSRAADGGELRVA
jgi:hypothetical protein